MSINFRATKNRLAPPEKNARQSPKKGTAKRRIPPFGYLGTSNQNLPRFDAMTGIEKNQPLAPAKKRRPRQKTQKIASPHPKKLANNKTDKTSLAYKKSTFAFVLLVRTKLLLDGNPKSLILPTIKQKFLGP